MHHGPPMWGNQHLHNYRITLPTFARRLCQRMHLAKLNRGRFFSSGHAEKGFNEAVNDGEATVCAFYRPMLCLLRLPDAAAPAEPWIAQVPPMPMALRQNSNLAVGNGLARTSATILVVEVYVKVMSFQ